MQYIASVVFLGCLGVTAYLLFKRIVQIKKTIQLGKPLDRTDHKSERLKNMLLMAFGQKKMFDKPLIGIMHFVVYAGFIIINLEMLEIAIDGILGTHRIFAPFLGNLYPILINIFELLAVGVIVFCGIFLIRRNILKIKRFQWREMTKWPKTDANIILFIEIFLMLAFLTMNATDRALQMRGAAHYTNVGNFWFSHLLTPLFINLSTTALIIVERTAWWVHILGVMAFAVYVTYSKHLHIFLAFPNSYFAKLTPRGYMKNMENVTQEVKLALGLMQESEIVPTAEGGKFGAKDINDLAWKNLMDAYACTECGRCTEQCPASQTGKLLSPRKIMMDTRDRLEEVGKQLQQGKTAEESLNDGKSLYGNYIIKEEILACTSCNACVEACPVSIDPLSIILEIRRYMAMEESSTPASWNAMFANLENNMAPWKFSPADRFNWKDKVNEV